VTVEEARNPVPLMVSVCGAAPTANEEGESEEMVGTGLTTLIAVELVSGVVEPSGTIIAGSVAEIGNGPPGVSGAR